MAVDVFGLADANIAASAGIQYSKLEPLQTVTHYATGTIVAASYYGPIVRGAAGLLIGFEAAIVETIATGGDRTVDVDLLKSTGAGAFATVLSAVIQFTSGSTLRQVVAATISSAAIQDGDHFKVTTAVAGAAGNQALGISITLKWWEDPA